MLEKPRRVTEQFFQLGDAIFSQRQEDCNKRLTVEQRNKITNAVNINNSDLDFCEFNWRTVIYYSWSNQKDTEFLAEAVYEGGLEDFLNSFF